MGLKDSSPGPFLAPEPTESMGSSVPGRATVFHAPSRPPVPPPNDSPNDGIGCRSPCPLRRGGNSIHITREEFLEESVQAQSELRNRQPQTHTYHPAFEGRADCAILAPTDTPDSNPAAGTIVPFERQAIFARGQQSCESKRDPSHGSGGSRFGRQAGTCGGAGGCRDGRASVRSVESARSESRFRARLHPSLFARAARVSRIRSLCREGVLFYQQGSAAPQAAAQLALPPAPNAGQHPAPGNLAPARRRPRTRSRSRVARHSSRFRVETRAQSRG